MIREFLKSGALYSLSGILSKLISVLLIPIYTKKLSPADYGVIDLYIVIGSFMAIIIGVEITQANARFFSSSENLKEKIQIASTSLWFTVSTFGIFVIVALLFNQELNIIITGDEQLNLTYRVAAISIFTQGIFYFFITQLKWMMLPRLYAIVNIIYVLISISVAASLIISNLYTAEGYFIGNISGSLVGGTLAYYFGRNIYSFKFNLSIARKLLNYSFPIIFSSVALILAGFIDRLVIKQLLGLGALGLYGVAFRFGSVIKLGLVGFQSGLAPLIYKNYKLKETPYKIEAIFRVFCFVSLNIIAFLTLFSDNLVELLTSPEYYSSSSMVPVIAFSAFFVSTHIFTPGMEIRKKTKLVAYINIGFALLNYVLNLILIHLIGLLGAAIATLVTTIVVFVIRMKLSQKYYYIPYIQNKLIIGTLLIIGLFSFLNYGIFDLYEIHYIITVKVLMFAVTVTAFYFLFTDKMDRRKINTKIINRTKILKFRA
ncbi:lipopolysaccharide biosynthesis protein [Fulvivirga lutimaris]|uniref:lipopolysaccharide biosynthesis protein n=1 Tax=Fulvivirga lutimaris TaxID=1819566 RepID=UPI0012BB7130|nr:oligosaccharide flippase family protein [Fulvivirga lutimaris]MTI38253.1 hypothetical protein [Fulvivirga lutimaris]